MRIGIDLGGTKTEILALSEDSIELTRTRVATPSGSYEAILEMILTLVQEVESAHGPARSVGVGTPGAISPQTGLLRNSNTVALNGKPFKADLSRLLKRGVNVANDANCFTLSEAVDGAARNGNVVFGVILGTGTGGGVVINKTLVSGLHAIAGEWGHNPLPWPSGPDELPGPACYCKKNGCIETFLSGPGLVADHARITGENRTPLEIAQSARHGDQRAADTLERYVNRLARSLASVINILDPEVIVLGGGLSNLDQLYEALPSRLTRYVFSDFVATPIVRAQHGDSSGVRGAVWLSS